MSSAIRVFVIDEQPLFCAGLERLLASEAEMQFLGAVSSFEKFRSEYQSLEPDIMMVSISCGEAILDALSDFQQQNNSCKTIFMLVHPFEICLQQVAKYEAGGCILKTDAPSQYTQAIRAVATGETYFSRRLLQETWQTQMLSEAQYVTENFAKQEVEILQMICAEKSNAEIAESLHISERTVSRYLENIYVKFNVKSRVGAAVKAVKIGVA